MLELVIASSISLIEQELLSSLKSFWSYRIMMISFVIPNIMIEIKDKIYKSTRVMDWMEGWVRTLNTLLPQKYTNVRSVLMMRGTEKRQHLSVTRLVG